MVAESGSRALKRIEGGLIISVASVFIALFARVFLATNVTFVIWWIHTKVACIPPICWALVHFHESRILVGVSAVYLLRLEMSTVGRRAQSDYEEFPTLISMLRSAACFCVLPV